MLAIEPHIKGDLGLWFGPASKSFLLLLTRRTVICYIGLLMECVLEEAKLGAFRRLGSFAQ